MAGGLNTYGYVGGSPVRYVDPLGLATAVVVGGPTSGNPFGHIAIGFTGEGIYSYGTNTPLGGSFTDYLAKQASYRNSTVYILNTTPEQEARMKSEILKFRGVSLPNPFQDPIGAAGDTCATRTQNALEAGGISSNFLPFDSPFPMDTEAMVILNGPTPINVPIGSSIPDLLSTFNK